MRDEDEDPAELDPAELVVKAFHAKAGRPKNPSELKDELERMAALSVADLLQNVTHQLRYGHMTSSPVVINGVLLFFDGVLARVAIVAVLAPVLDERVTGDALRDSWNELLRMANNPHA